MASKLQQRAPGSADVTRHVIEPSAWFERAIAGLLLAADKRRLRAIVAVAPTWVTERILEARESIRDVCTTLLGEQLKNATRGTATCEVQP